jgi:DNA-binding transcriptional LysR family regulator
MLNPLRLRALTAVLNTGSFAAAARRLGYTGSAVPQQLAALERAVRMPRTCPIRDFEDADWGKESI